MFLLNESAVAQPEVLNEGVMDPLINFFCKTDNAKKIKKSVDENNTKMRSDLKKKGVDVIKLDQAIQAGATKILGNKNLRENAFILINEAAASDVKNKQIAADFDSILSAITTDFSGSDTSKTFLLLLKYYVIMNLIVLVIAAVTLGALGTTVGTIIFAFCMSISAMVIFRGHFYKQVQAEYGDVYMLKLWGAETLVSFILTAGGTGISSIIDYFYIKLLLKKDKSTFDLVTFIFALFPMFAVAAI